MSLKVFLNGKILPIEQAKISIFDRGFLYGDGVFESLRTYHGKPFLLEEHLKRLHKGLKLLRINIAKTLNYVKTQKIIKRLMKANRLSKAYIKIIITRGEAKGHGLDPKKTKGKPTIIMVAEKLTEYSSKTFTKGWRAIIASIRRPEVPTSRIKSLNYLNSVLAKMEAKESDAEEAIFLDGKGNITEGTISNIFVVKHGTIYTPSLHDPILAGVTRALVMKLARQAAFKVEERTLTPKELYAADEAFVTFSGAGIIPITSIWKKKIGKGKPGSTTTKLISLYNQVVK